jgi:hypothetical protein
MKALLEVLYKFFVRTPLKAGMVKKLLPVAHGMLAGLANLSLLVILPHGLMTRKPPARPVSWTYR